MNRFLDFWSLTSFMQTHNHKPTTTQPQTHNYKNLAYFGCCIMMFCYSTSEIIKQSGTVFVSHQKISFVCKYFIICTYIIKLTSKYFFKQKLFFSRSFCTVNVVQKTIIFLSYCLTQTVTFEKFFVIKYIRYYF